MQPPHDTQRFPAHDRPGVQNAETQQFAAAPGQPWPPGAGQPGAGQPGAGQPDSADTGPGLGGERAGGRGGGRGSKLALIVVLVAVILMAGVVALEFGIRNAVKNQIQDEVTASLGTPAQVELGSRPVLLSYFGGDLGSVHITTDGTATEGATGPAPAIDITAAGVSSEGDLTFVDSLSGTAFVSEQAMATAAQQDPTGGNMLGGLVQVQDIVADPDEGTLRVSIGGLAEAVVTPRLIGGNLEMEPSQASIFGFQLPSELLGGTISMMDSALAELPDGIQLTGVRVVPGGMIIDLGGQDIVLESTR